MLPLDQRIQDAWVAHIASHSGGRQNNPLTPQIHAGVSTAGAQPANGNGDFGRLEQYIGDVQPAQFKRDVTYQLYYVTECLIWLWKRLPRPILLRAAGDPVDAEIAALLRNFNAGTWIEDLDDNERQALRDKRNGQMATPRRNRAVPRRAPTGGSATDTSTVPDNDAGEGEPIVQPTELRGGELVEAIVDGQAHEPPPPPPGWPPQP